MAITLADFNKIWASTSPLTPYSFSESNYKQGWNFIGSTPPARQMWDFLQKNNDEKMKYIVDNYLPLSGGTMTGEIVRSGLLAKSSVDNDDLSLDGGTTSESAYLQLNGKNRSSSPGGFLLHAGDGSNDAFLSGKPDGTLTWGGNAVITSAGGTMTGDLIGNIVGTASYVKQVSIPTNADLNDYQTPGSYYVGSNSVAQSLSNCPSTEAFSLLVNLGGAGCTQLMISSNNIHFRFKTSSSWNPWRVVTSTTI